MSYIERETAENAIAAIMPTMNRPDGCGENDHLIFATQEMCVDAIQTIHNLPSTDVVPVRHGEWLTDENRDRTWCSVCNVNCGVNYAQAIEEMNYCPNCGARMDGDSNAGI